MSLPTNGSTAGGSTDGPRSRATNRRSLATRFAVRLLLLIGAPLLAANSLAAPAADVAAPQSKLPAVTTTRMEQSKDQMTKLPSAAALRPSGPVTITARRAELVQGDSAVYIGNVQLESNTLKMDGDRLELKQHPNGHYEAHITGNPGHLAHSGTGVDDPSVSAHAKTLNYDSRSGVVDLLGDALFKRGEDQITGDTIHYDLIERRIQADGGNDSPVHIILQAPPPPTRGGAASGVPELSPSAKPADATSVTAPAATSESAPAPETQP